MLNWTQPLHPPPSSPISICAHLITNDTPLPPHTLFSTVSSLLKVIVYIIQGASNKYNFFNSKLATRQPEAECSREKAIVENFNLFVKHFCKPQENHRNCIV